MTIEHAIHYLCNLRDESPSANASSGTWLPGCPPSPTPRRAKKLAEAAGIYWRLMDLYPPSGRCDSVAGLEWQRLYVRVYDESERLREIAEGRR